jgi:hypothetical protein
MCKNPRLAMFVEQVFTDRTQQVSLELCRGLNLFTFGYENWIGIPGCAVTCEAIKSLR